MEDFELPIAAEINRDLFSDEIEVYKNDIESFDVDKFLMKNNLQYIQLDSLIRSVDDLSRDVIQNLSAELINKYTDYTKFCLTYAIDGDKLNNNESLAELEKTKTNLYEFISQLELLIAKDIPRTKEVISDTTSYLSKVNEIEQILVNHIRLNKTLARSKELSDALHHLCGSDVLDEPVILELMKQLNKLVLQTFAMLRELDDLDSPYIRHLRNDYQSLIQTFQISMKILVEKCISDPDNYTNLATELVLIMKQTQQLTDAPSQE
ncbi:hypothetical protein TPHA_0D04150 [Tetrapisispora phaffii CBS 4417]|uniref:Conserved oligomeric Golgi complex subunit 2 C-terminal domain-containing protein n=1 Tax=Tetrapisispora phaffii (strain ATCC 24235 / CBS 4417 / NBRC 1672 / NRRL Y-8282 / UCD 70-5) TaxID=1071381 RepID=G8BT77_TETPH|nr:hypothetical protein TPHA_0D04150 [Tetrapisispora phaffii CBS 4417]CCE63048.1 hypothetical protein TPHA_0D04150 [Tetrapisispora phaffii CBS 4417]